MFLFIGILNTGLTFSLILAYLFNKKLHKHPNSILFQILMIQFVISIKYLVTGTAFKVFGHDLDHTPMRLKDFGFLNYG
jgi:uncharacterized protein YacL